MHISKKKLILLFGIVFLEQSESATLSLPKVPTCGQSPVKPQPLNYLNIFSRIVGGRQVAKGSYPWQVSLKRRQKHVCGGTIISPQWVITAAHCVANRNTVSTFNVTAGEYDLRYVEPGEQTLTIETIIIHPHFSTKKPMDYDIALLKMAGAFHFDQFVGPMCLPEPGEQFKPGFICTTAGWGRLNENGVAPQVLQEVNLPILTQDECITALLTLEKPISGRTFLCTGFPDGGRDACQGDSGGSLMCRNKKGTWTLAGVTSWGLGCGRGWKNNLQKDDQGSPGIFTDLTKVLSWIHKHIRIATCSEQDRVVRASEGELHFPESPFLYYESKQQCAWTLLAPEGMHVLLSFSHFDAESCDHNYLSIYSLEDTLIAKFCGERLASSVLIGSNAMRLSFISDNTDYAVGFNLTYKALKPNYLPDSGCDSLTILFEEGLIQSLHYPEDYSDMASCNWVFQAPKHYLVKLSFQDLKIEENGDCTSDYVSIHRDVERKKEIARLCGFAVPTPVVSITGVMSISFQSNENTTFRGFQATVSFIHETDFNISGLENESVFLETWNVPPEESKDSGIIRVSSPREMLRPGLDGPFPARLWEAGGRGQFLAIAVTWVVKASIHDLANGSPQVRDPLLSSLPGHQHHCVCRSPTDHGPPTALTRGWSFIGVSGTEYRIWAESFFSL
nr:ovochymase-2 isoform X2 [Odocoileus virginianus texanus]